MTQRGSAKKPAPETKRRSSGLVVTLLVLVFASIAAAKWHDRQVVDETNVTGTTELSAIAVQTILDSCIDERRGALVLSDVRDQLEQIPFVLNANVCFSDVRGLAVEIKEREPVAHIVESDGSLRYVDASGTILPDVVVRTAHCVPLLRFESTYDKASLKEAVALVTKARCDLEPCLYASISEFVVSRDASIRVLTDGLTWNLGEVASLNVTDAYANMNVFWNRLSSTTELGSDVMIDLRWKKHVVVQQTQRRRS